MPLVPRDELLFVPEGGGRNDHVNPSGETAPLQRLVSDLGGDARYDGPCPPTNLPPNVHHYVFTVYALRSELSVPSSANFPANVEALFHALLDAAMRGEVLGSASMTGLYSTTPGT